MPLNKSDKKFFDWLNELKSQRPAASNDAQNIDEVREGAKLFESFIDQPANISFEDRYFTTTKGHRLRLRYYPKLKKIQRALCANQGF